VLAGYLRGHRVTLVAMEATSVFWTAGHVHLIMAARSRRVLTGIVTRRRRPPTSSVVPRVPAATLGYGRERFACCG
jgi:hypothetical protein